MKKKTYKTTITILKALLILSIITLTGLTIIHIKAYIAIKQTHSKLIEQTDTTNNIIINETK